MPPLLADFTHARPCKPFCEKYLTLPSLLSVIGGWGGVLPPHFGRKKAGDLFQISCSVCRCEGGGYLVVKVRDKLTRWVDGTLKNYGSLVISSLA